MSKHSIFAAFLLSTSLNAMTISQPGKHAFAGLKEGDKVLSVNGKAVSGDFESIKAAMKTIYHSKGKHKVVVKRNNKEITMILEN